MSGGKYLGRHSWAHEEPQEHVKSKDFRTWHDQSYQSYCFKEIAMVASQSTNSKRPHGKTKTIYMDFDLYLLLNKCLLMV